MHSGNPLYRLECLFPEQRLRRSDCHWDVFRLSFFLSDPFKPLEIIEVVAFPYQGGDIFSGSR